MIRQSVTMARNRDVHRHPIHSALESSSLLRARQEVLGQVCAARSNYVGFSFSCSFVVHFKGAGNETRKAEGKHGASRSKRKRVQERG